MTAIKRRTLVKMASVTAGATMVGGLHSCETPSKELSPVIPLSERPKVSPAEKPNIIFILSDQHRPDALGCNGNPVIQTPNLDNMADKGFNLTNSYCASPICQPSRASLLTGRYPHQMGITDNHADDIDTQWETMPRNLQQAGYQTP